VVAIGHRRDIYRRRWATTTNTNHADDDWARAGKPERSRYRSHGEGALWSVGPVVGRRPVLWVEWGIHFVPPADFGRSGSQCWAPSVVRLAGPQARAAVSRAGHPTSRARRQRAG